MFGSSPGASKKRSASRGKPLNFRNSSGTSALGQLAQPKPCIPALKPKKDPKLQQAKVVAAAEFGVFLNGFLKNTPSKTELKETEPPPKPSENCFSMSPDKLEKSNCKANVARKYEPRSTRLSSACRSSDPRFVSKSRNEWAQNELKVSRQRKSVMSVIKSSRESPPETLHNSSSETTPLSFNESIDLTADCDEETPSSCEHGFISRRDLFQVTGSTSAGVDVGDLEISTSQPIEVEDSINDCEFLDSWWIGQDSTILGQCRRTHVPSENLSDVDEADRQEVLTISAPGTGSFVLTGSDLKCLSETEWLNDEVINAYMCLLQMRSNAHNIPPCSLKCEDSAKQSCGSGSECCAMPKCVFFSSFFYAILRNARGGYCYDNVRRWGQRRDLAHQDLVFFPINVNNCHWCLAVVVPACRQIRYYDSLGGSNSHCLDLLERYLQDEAAARGLSKLSGSWNKVSLGPPTVPAQFDGCSCGLFVCAFADCLSGGRDPPDGFSQRDMPALRHRLRELFSRGRAR